MRASITLVLLIAANPARAAEAQCVAVLATTDTHGTLEPTLTEAGDAKVRQGGFAALSGYVATVRARVGERWLLVDGGDLYQGTLASNLSKGRAVIDAFNLLGVDAAAIGNHDFDFGPEESGSEDRLGALKARIQQAHFAFLGLNVFERDTHQRAAWAKPSLLLTRGGIRIGVIGAANPETPRVTRPQNVTSLEFRDPAPLIIAEARRLRAQGAQLVVMTAHIGGRCRSTADPDDSTSCESHMELFELLNRLPAGTLDVAVGGHTHANVAHWLNGIATVQTGARTQQLGWVDACLRPEGGIDRAASKIHPIIDLCLDEWADGGCGRRQTAAAVGPATFLGKPVQPDPRLAAAMQPYLTAVREAYERPVGVTPPQALMRDSGATPLGDVICDALNRAAGTRIAVNNRGGVRADLPAGPLKFGQVFEVLPFDNRIAVLTLSGAEVRAFIDALVKRRSGTLPFLSGLTRRGKRGDLQLADGTPLDDHATYQVATSDFLAQGGEGLDALFGKLGDDKLRILDTSMLEALIDHLRVLYPQGGAEQAKGG